MKKEILRINNLNYEYAEARKLKNISLCILEGECVGFFGLAYSGKDLLVRLLNGEAEEGAQDYFVYIDGRKVNGQALREMVYHMTESNFMIDDWTVAEYIGLVNAGWWGMVFRKRSLEEEIRQYFEKLSIDIDVGRVLKDLTEFEKRIVDLAKAIRRGARLAVIEDEFEGMTQDAMETFAATMKRLTKGRMAVIVNSHSNMVLSTLSDKYVIFSRGHIVKKCSKSYIRDMAHLESFFIGDSGIYGGILPKSRLPGQPAGRDTVYRVCGVRLQKERREDFCFARGEAVTFLVLDRRRKERLFTLFSGREGEEGVYYMLEDERYDRISIDVPARKKIVSIRHLGGMDEIFAEMTVGENLLLPSLDKISSLEYITSSGGFSRMLTQDMVVGEAEQDRAARNLGINDRIGMTLERWYIYNPLALVLFEPFAQCDAYGVSIVRSYIRKFTARGASVIMIKSRDEYVEDISDRIVNID